MSDPESVEPNDRNILTPDVAADVLESAPDRPDLPLLVRRMGESASVRTFFLAGLFVLAVIYSL